LKVDDLKLEVVIRPDALEVGDRIGGLIQRIPHANGHIDHAALSALMQQLKTRFPDKASATLLSQPDTPYEVLIQVMDTVREVPTSGGAKAKPVALFPEISIGDAPISSKKT
jgi:hypothetical protein